MRCFKFEILQTLEGAKIAKFSKTPATVQEALRNVGSYNNTKEAKKMAFKGEVQINCKNFQNSKNGRNIL